VGIVNSYEVILKIRQIEMEKWSIKPLHGGIDVLPGIAPLSILTVRTACISLFTWYSNIYLARPLTTARATTATMSRLFCIPGVVLLFCALVLSFLASISLPYLPALDVARVRYVNGTALDNSSVPITEYRVSSRLFYPFY
jgi:hypothetical protein